MTLIYPKKWPPGLLYLKSPTSHVVHLCHGAKENNDPNRPIALPLCGVHCWDKVHPTLPEDLQEDHLRFCKNCLSVLEEDPKFWGDFLAKRTDFIHLQHCQKI